VKARFPEHNRSPLVSSHSERRGSSNRSRSSLQRTQAGAVEPLEIVVQTLDPSLMLFVSHTIHVTQSRSSARSSAPSSPRTPLPHHSAQPPQPPPRSQNSHLQHIAGFHSHTHLTTQSPEAETTTCDGVRRDKLGRKKHRRVIVSHEDPSIAAEGSLMNH